MLRKSTHAHMRVHTHKHTHLHALLTLLLFSFHPTFRCPSCLSLPAQVGEKRAHRVLYALPQLQHHLWSQCTPRFYGKTKLMMYKTVTKRAGRRRKHTLRGTWPRFAIASAAAKTVWTSSTPQTCDNDKNGILGGIRKCLHYKKGEDTWIYTRWVYSFPLLIHRSPSTVGQFLSSHHS